MTSARVGTVFLEHFDVGVATTIGGELIEVERDGEVVQQYALRVAGVSGPDVFQGLVPIIFDSPEDAYQHGWLPHVNIMRSNLTPSPMNRWQPGGRVYRIAAPGAPMATSSKGVVGPTRVEQKTPAYPFDISYDIHLRGRLRLQADRMLKQVGKRLGFPIMYGVLYLIDTEGDARSYEAFVESIDGLSDIIDITDREIGHTISVRVEGELDFEDPVVVRTFSDLVINVEVVGTSTIGDI